MSISTNTTRGNVIDELNDMNREVAERVTKKIGINPRTRIVGFSRGFGVDLRTGYIYVDPDTDRGVVKGYLTHENGHRSVFPVSSAGSVAFISAVKALAPEASDEEVITAANIVADAFSDYILFAKGLGPELARRIPDFLTRSTPANFGMIFKIFVYKAIEYATKRGVKHISDEDIENTHRWLLNLGLNPDIVNKVRGLVEDFVSSTENLLQNYEPKSLAEFLLNPFKATDAPYLSYLAYIAKQLIRYDRNLNNQLSQNQYQCQCSSSGGRSTGSGGTGRNNAQQTTQVDSGRDSSSQPEKSVERSSEGIGQDSEKKEHQHRGKDGTESDKGGKKPVEGIDIVPSSISVTDVLQAMVILSKSFGIDIGSGEMLAIEKIFSKELREAVKKLIEKLRLVYAQNDFKVYKPSGYEKKSSELWLKPMGEPDEDSMIMEPRKLMWRTIYHVPHPRGKLHISPASVPEKLIIVQDESGSTRDEFYGASVISVEAFISLVTLAGLRYKKGAKEIEVVKFSDNVKITYSGSDEVEAGVKILIPHKGAGGGTNIVAAIMKAIQVAKKNAAIVVTTDALIPTNAAEFIGKELRYAIDSGRVGFVVFVIVNKADDPSIELIKRYLHGKNAIVEHVKSANDLTQLSTAIIGHILSVYSSS